MPIRDRDDRDDHRAAGQSKRDRRRHPWQLPRNATEQHTRRDADKDRYDLRVFERALLIADDLLYLLQMIFFADAREIVTELWLQVG